MRCEAAICASVQDKLFKMAPKMQSYDENEYQKRSPLSITETQLSNTGIPTE